MTRMPYLLSTYRSGDRVVIQCEDDDKAEEALSRVMEWLHSQVETTTEPLFPEGVFRAKDGNCVQRESAAGDTPAKPARDADHCDFPDCEQHYRYIAMQLDGYALHRHECARLRNADPDSPTYGKCTCGLDELLKSLNDSPEKHQEGKGP